MPALPLVESIRQAVLAGFEQRGQPGVSAACLRESLLIRNGYYAGRRFSCGGLTAVWRADKGEIVFLAEEPASAKTMPLETGRGAA